MERQDLLARIFDEKTVKLLEKLLAKKDVFYLRELSKEADVSLATTYRIVQKLIALGLAEKSQQGKFTIYRLRTDSPAFAELRNVISGQASDPIETLQKLLRETFPEQPMMMYLLKDGKKVFIVGDINAEKVENIAKTIQSRTGAALNLLAISSDQFSKMQDMGLIGPGRAISID